MATRSGKTASGKRDSGTHTPSGDPRQDRSAESRLRTTATGRNSQVGSTAGGRSGRDAKEQLSGPNGSSKDVSPTGSASGQNGQAGGVICRTRRILIFAKNFKDASAIAKKKGYPRELWRYVTGPADTADLDPREWATITVPGFHKESPQAKDAYDIFQAHCRGYGIRVPSYDP